MNKGILKVLKSILYKRKQNLLDLPISSKIMMYYLVLLIISMTVSSIIYQQIFSNIISGKISGIAFQMLHSISANFNSSIDIGSEYSKIITANEDVQNYLRKFSENDNFYNELKATSTMARLIGGVQLISSVYIFDNYGSRNYAYKDAVKVLNVGSIDKANWYKEVKQKRGGYIIRLDAGGVLEPAAASSAGAGANYISLIREINDLDTQKTMGIIIVNIPESAIRKTLKSIVSDYNSEVDILDDNNNIAVNTGNRLNFDVAGFAAKSSGKDSNWTIWKNNNTEYMVAYLRMPENGWKIVSILPIRQLSKENSIFSLVTIMMIVVNSLLLFVGSIIVSRLITVPVKKLIKSMKGIETGKFKKVDIKAGNDEIGMLRDGYNTMIGEIQNLISRIVEEQKIKRKTELDVLQAQIKPHFLYNTFDAISSLALSGKNKDVYNIMKALGTYYRTSLSKGSEVITVGEEIDVVVNYLKIQKYRYEDMFSVEYDIDEEAKSYKILKLVLQPFVENALYHGIRPMGSSGKIIVSAKRMSDCILLQIIDDGVGMDHEEIEKLTNYKIETESHGFGVRGTIERLKIFYGIENIVTIDSEKGMGTRVSIRIPLQGEFKDAK